MENFAPRVLPGLGLDWAAFQAVNPRLAMVSISNYGQSGPNRDLAGTNLTLFAAGGQMSVTGEPDQEPLLNGGTQPLMQAGLHGYSATVTAIYGARAHGIGNEAATTGAAQQGDGFAMADEVAADGVRACVVERIGVDDGEVDKGVEVEIGRGDIGDHRIGPHRSHRYLRPAVESAAAALSERGSR